MSHSNPSPPEQNPAGCPLTDIHDASSQAAVLRRVYEYEHAASQHPDPWSRVARPMAADLLRSAIPMEATARQVLTKKTAALETLRAADTELKRLLPLTKQIGRVLAIEVSRTIGSPRA
jgi:hypothetical protein